MLELVICNHDCISAAEGSVVDMVAMEVEEVMLVGAQGRVSLLVRYIPLYLISHRGRIMIFDFGTKRQCSLSSSK